MDCTIYEWETGGEFSSPFRPQDRRALLKLNLEGAFPMIVDERFLEMLRALDEETGETARGQSSP